MPKSTKHKRAIGSSKSALQALLKENQRLSKENEKLALTRNQLFIELEKYRGIRGQLRMLVGNIYNLINKKADLFAYPSNYYFPREKVVISSDRSVLLKTLAAYDKKVLTERRTMGPYWRRMISLLIKKSLRIAKKSGRVIMKVARRIR